MKTWIKDLERHQFGSGEYSQSYQDELVDIIFANIGTINPVPFCVEFGFNSSSLTAGSGANVARSILKNGWASLLLDGDNENPQINLCKYFLTPSNICEIFKCHNVPEKPEYVSIDVDSIDLWLFEAVLKEYRAMVFSVEYNSHYPLDSAITFPNDLNERWEHDRGFGASLKALNIVAKSNGYSLLWVVPTLDAFFIRNDLIDDGSSQICFPFEKWASCTNIVHHRPLIDPKRVKIFMDYEVYISTNGDVSASRRAAHDICKKYLIDNFPQKVFLKAKRIAKRIIRRASAWRATADSS